MNFIQSSSINVKNEEMSFLLIVFHSVFPMHRLVFDSLIMMIHCRILHCLLCFQNDSFSYSTNNFTLKHLENVFRKEIFAEKLYCGGTIQWNVVSKELMVKFSVDQFEMNVVGFKNIHLETKLILEFIRDDSIKHQVTFLCYNRDRCDQSLILEQCEQILFFNYTMLLKTLRTSFTPITSAEKRNECSIGKNLQVEKCSGRTCFSRYIYKTNQIDGQCLFNTSTFLPKILVRTSFNARERLRNESTNRTLFYQRDWFSENLTIDFFCSLNNCNNRRTSESIIKTVQKYYYVWLTSKLKTNEILIENFTTTDEFNNENHSSRKFYSISLLICSMLILFK